MDSATSATDSGSNSQRPQLTTTNVRRRRRRQRRPRGSSATRQPDQGPSVAPSELERNQQTQQQHEHITTTIGNPTDTTARESNSITCSSTTTKHEQKQISPDKAELLVSEQTSSQPQSPETSNSENSNQLEKVDLNLVSPQAPSLSSAIQRGRRNHQDPASGLRTPPSAPRPRVAPARRTRSANRPPPEPTRLATSRGRLSTSSVVRVLFRDQQEQQQHQQEQQQRQNVIRGQLVSHTSSIGLTVRPVNQSASIVEANRRLVERQIEAIQMADSTRWNFDFRNCRPMHLAGHRYVHCSVIDSTDADDNNNNNDNINNNNNINHDDNTNNNSTNTTTQRNCRPLNDQNQGQNSS